MSHFFLHKVPVQVPLCALLFGPHLAFSFAPFQSYIHMCPLFVLCTFFVHTPLALFASQYYLKVCLLNICAPTLDNALHLPHVVYYITVPDLLSWNPFYFIVRCVADIVYKCFLAAPTGSVRGLRLCWV